MSDEQGARVWRWGINCLRIGAVVTVFGLGLGFTDRGKEERDAWRLIAAGVGSMIAGAILLRPK